MRVEPDIIDRDDGDNVFFCGMQGQYNRWQYEALVNEFADRWGPFASGVDGFGPIDIDLSKRHFYRMMVEYGVPECVEVRSLDVGYSC